MPAAQFYWLPIPGVYQCKLPDGREGMGPTRGAAQEAAESKPVPTRD